MLKYRLLRDRVATELLGVDLLEAPSASVAELELAHSAAYVAAVLEGTLSAAAQREIGFPWSPQMVERSRRSVGASVAAARAALQSGVAVNLAGGTHHAHADRGSGFCVFNDVVVAARTLQAERRRLHDRELRVAVVDLDVHQGNGTAAICRDDPSIFTLSLHGAKNFPFRKEPGDLDVELPDGCDDERYLAALDAALERIWPHLQADREGAADALIFFLAGADPHEADRLGRLKLTAAGLAERDRRVLAAALERRVPVVLSMAGGYGQDINATVALQLNTVRLAFEHWQRWAA